MSKIKPSRNDVRLTMAVVSDTHLDIKHPAPIVPQWLLYRAVRDAAKSARPLDAFIIPGDTVSDGETVNWDMAVKVFQKAGKPAGETVIQIGNHDTWSEDGTDAAVQRYFDYTETITGERYPHTYFTKIVNGYHLLFLSNEKEGERGALIGDEQMAWFRKALAEAAQSGRPVFVFCHHPLNGTHGLPMTADADGKPDDDPMEGGIGRRSDEVAALLKQYRDVWYISGHSHMGVSAAAHYETDGYSSFEEMGGVHLVNLPSLACGNHHGECKKLGCGIVIEVYDNEVVIRPRDFKARRWLKRYACRWKTGGKE